MAERLRQAQKTILTDMAVFDGYIQRDRVTGRYRLVLPFEERSLMYATYYFLARNRMIELRHGVYRISKVGRAALDPLLNK